MSQSATAGAVSEHPRGSTALTAEHRFFAAMAAMVVLVVTVGFGRVYGPRLVGAAPATTGLIHLHAAIFTLWVVAFCAQVAFAVRGKIALHRRFGTAGMVLAPLMLIVGAATALASARLGHHGIPGVEFANVETFLLLNLAALFVFGVLSTAAFALRRRPQAHKRLMLMATVGGLLPPAIARLPLVTGHVPAIAAITMGALLAGPVFELVRTRRVHLAYVFGFLVNLCALPPIVEQVAASALWHRLAEQLMRIG